MKENKINNDKKKPNFIRGDSNRKKQFKSWRKPRGIHNKLRLNKKGHQKKPAIGYGSPKKLRGKGKNDLIPVVILNANELEKIDKSKNSITIGKNLGLRKKLDILTKIKEKGFIVDNIKDVDKFIEEKNKLIQFKKEEKKKKSEKRKEKKKSLEEKSKEKKKSEKEEKQKKAQEFAEKIKEDMKKKAPK